jgi:tetratricopeptide (TPR) repeat protein
MAKKSAAQAVIDPTNFNAITPQEYLHRGWLFYSRQNYAKSEDDFRRAVALNPDDPDTLYALGMLLSASGRSQEAVAAFENALKSIDKVSNHNRATMLRRLLNAHISRIKTGDWHLLR